MNFKKGDAVVLPDGGKGVIVKILNKKDMKKIGLPGDKGADVQLENGNVSPFALESLKAAEPAPGDSSVPPAAPKSKAQLRKEKDAAKAAAKKNLDGKWVKLPGGAYGLVREHRFASCDEEGDPVIAKTDRLTVDTYLNGKPKFVHVNLGEVEVA